MYAEALRHGLSPESFWDMTWAEYCMFIRGVREKKEWEMFQVRELITFHANLNRDSKKPPFRGQDIMYLPSIDGMQDAPTLNDQEKQVVNMIKFGFRPPFTSEKAKEKMLKKLIKYEYLTTEDLQKAGLEIDG